MNKFKEVVMKVLTNEKFAKGVAMASAAIIGKQIFDLGRAHGVVAGYHEAGEMLEEAFDNARNDILTQEENDSEETQ